jgi:hypothetical protein
MWKLPNWPLWFIREKLGEEASLTLNGSSAVLMYDVEDGRAVILGSVGRDDLIVNGKLILAHSDA